tara:strand:- start:74 stop:385 length:312 start_codon:yes stop_codon:yes gene_type:complete
MYEIGKTYTFHLQEEERKKIEERTGQTPPEPTILCPLNEEKGCPYGKAAMEAMLRHPEIYHELWVCTTSGVVEERGEFTELLDNFNRFQALNYPSRRKNAVFR